MRSRTMATAVAILTLLVGALMPAFALASTSSPYTRQIASAGTTSFRSTSEGTGELQWPEFPGAVDSGEAAGSVPIRLPSVELIGACSAIMPPTTA